jgi:lactoylglutathione lyase
VITSGLVNLYTADIEAGMRFWGSLLGLSETFRTPREGVPAHVEYAAGGFTVALGTVEAARQVHGIEPTPGQPAGVVVLWSDDVDATVASLRDAGVTVAIEPRAVGNDNRAALVRDPDGHLVEIFTKRP